MSDIAWETLFFFLAMIAAGAIFTIVWSVLHWVGILEREDDRPRDHEWMRRP